MSFVHRIAMILLTTSVMLPAQADILIGMYGDGSTPQNLVRFSDEAQSDVAPPSLLGGPSTAYLAATEEVAVIDSDMQPPYASKILVFNRTDGGNVAPKRVIKGHWFRLGLVRARVGCRVAALVHSGAVAVAR